jgi:hypothetical protein
MNIAEQKLIIACRRTATSHRHDGCKRTADLLERAANKIERLLNAADHSNLNPATGLEQSVLRVPAKGSLPGRDCLPESEGGKQ